MRPTTRTMLQQNNNNNYPCLNMSGSTQEMLQKCSRAAPPFPSRLELGDLPLIRGLRAWALCSKNRRKAGALLGGRQPPTAPHGGRGNLTSCSKPAGVYLSGEWGRMKYGLPLGMDGRQAEIGALVTVATLKTSEGSGKTQTQCLFLQTEKGSCLYSTAKPGSGGTTGAGSSVVGGWLRGKTGGGGRGGRDASVGRRDTGPNLPAQTGANRVRVGSARRWRKSGNAAGREKPAVSRERQQRSREDPAGEITLEERKEVRDQGALGSKQTPSPQQDSKKGRQEKDGVCRAPRCCHNTSPKTCSQCRRRAQRRGSQEEHEGGESPSSAKKGVRKERQKKEEEGDVCEVGPPNLALAAPSADLESNPECPRGCDVEEIREAKRNEELKRPRFHGKDSSSEKEQDTDSDAVETHTGNHDLVRGPSEEWTDGFTLSHDKGLRDGGLAENPCEEAATRVNGSSGRVEANREFVKEMEGADVEEEERSVSQTPAASSAVSNCYKGVSVPNCPAPICTGSLPESSAPLEGSICTAELAACVVQQEQGNSQEEHLEEYGTCEQDHEELEAGRFEPREGSSAVRSSKNGKPQAFFENEACKTSSSPLTIKELYVSETDERSGCRTTECEQGDELMSEEDNLGKRLNPEVLRREDVEMNTSVIQGDNSEVKRHRTPADNRALQQSAHGCGEEGKGDGDACSQASIAHVEASGKTGTSVTNVACAEPFSSPAPSLANPAPPLPPLGSMATGLPCVVVAAAQEEEEGAGVTPRDGEGGQEGTRRHRREPEERSEGEWGSTVATEDAGKEVEEGEEDEFGVFMQAEGELAWSEGFAMSASVPRGSRESVAHERHAVTGQWSRWTPGWTDSTLPQSGDTWTAFPLDPPAGSAVAVGQWWPTSAVERRTHGGPNVVSVLAEAFPSSPTDLCDLDAVPTLTQLLRRRAGQDQGLLDSFHDLNKMIGQRYRRASGASRDLLLKTLHLEQPQTESRAAPWTASRRLSPGLSSANRHAHNVAAKRRLSYDYNRNIME